ncbi:MAG TPA: CopD family protein [Sediminibacterium sp.]|nr:CopD family protein [Sediminibacterium sp.]
MYNYIKALHIIFVVTWFAGMFYMPRLFIYNTEANEKKMEIKNALQTQYKIMMKRLWYGITWPSAILTMFLGVTVLVKGNWYKLILYPSGKWLFIKLILVILLYLYHFSLHKIFKLQLNNCFKYSTQQLRIWNEVATIYLIAIVMLATVKDGFSFIWGIIGLLLLISVLMLAIRVYKSIRQK